MPLTLTQNYTATTPGTEFVQFLGIGGVEPYTYAVEPGGAGGTIDSSTGEYTAPALMTAYPATGMIDTITVTDDDAVPAVAEATILVGSPLFLVLDILKTELSLDSNHIFIFDQKIFQPTDSGLYVIVGIESCKPFGNSISSLPEDGSQVLQWISMYARLSIEVISRGPAARDYNWLIPLALNSIYSQQQQEANSFYLGKLPIEFTNISGIDGAAIPYRFHYSWAMQYVNQLTKAVPYFDTFEDATIATDP